MAKAEKTIADLEDMPEYQVGIWKSPYVKVYSIGGKNRIVEISNYPRAYKDTEPHRYTEDVPFTVTKSDLNYRDADEGWVYADRKGNKLHVGDKATHWKGDPLPGAFPLWIESEDLPFTPDPDEHVFPIGDVKAPIMKLIEINIKKGGKFTKPSEQDLDDMSEDLTKKTITRKRKPRDSDKQIMRIRYMRLT